MSLLDVISKIFLLYGYQLQTMKKSTSYLIYKTKKELNLENEVELSMNAFLLEYDNKKALFA